MFPIEIERIGAGFVQGVGKLITNRAAGSWAVGSTSVELSTYRWGTLFSRVKVAAPGRKVQLTLGDGEVAIVEDVA